MTLHDAAALGSRIREARERAGTSQAELARSVSLERTILSKIEAGTRRVTALELSDLADALGVRMVTLLEEPLPALVSHRSSQGLDTTDSRIDRALETLATEVEFVQSLAPLDHADDLDPGDDWPVPSTSSDAEDLAEKAREFLGLGALAPITELATLSQRVGLWAFGMDLGPDLADAGMVLLRRGGVAIVNSNNKIGRRRLALAHELGHYLLQDPYTVDWKVSVDGSSLEAHLDRFARALLLPATGLRQAWQIELAARSVRERAVLVASRFQVDMATLARRVAELRIDADLDEIRRTRTTRTDIVEHGLLPSSGELEGTWLPPRYQLGVIGLYRGERISPERALDLLQGTFSEDDLPSRRRRSEGEIWNFVS